MEQQFKVVMALDCQFYKLPQEQLTNCEVQAHHMTNRTVDELLSILNQHSVLRLD